MIQEALAATTARTSDCTHRDGRHELLWTMHHFIPTPWNTSCSNPCLSHCYSWAAPPAAGGPSLRLLAARRSPFVLPVKPHVLFSHGFRPGSSAGDASHDAVRAKLGEHCVITAHAPRFSQTFRTVSWRLSALLTPTIDFRRQRRRIPSSLLFSSHGVGVIFFGCSSTQQ